MGNFCQGASSIEQDVLAFQLRNMYTSNTIDGEITKIILQRIAPGSKSNEYTEAAQYISGLPKQEFVDKNFKTMEIDLGISGEIKSLKKAYNFEKLNLDSVYKLTPTDPEIFDQGEVQLCYSSTVFYLICRSEQLKQQIFVTTFVNPHNAYILNLYCNGELTPVYVDDNVPAFKTYLKYMSISNPKELWPFLLEKAWCKQIGGYDKARGLSPEDCFEEITGIPAHSLSLSGRYAMADLRDFLVDALNKRYWVTLTAKNIQIGIKARQVFYVQRYNEGNQTLKLQSPFKAYQLPQRQGLQKSQRKGQLIVQLSSLTSFFQYITIGTYQAGYTTTTTKFESQKNQELIFELLVHRQGKANIRIVQFYNQYLNQIDKDLYHYSPVLMELYNEEFRIINKCQGVLENFNGVRSARLSDENFVELRPGKYYLRVQVDWHQDLYKKIGSILIYSPKNLLTLTKSQSQRTNFLTKALQQIFKLLSMSLQNHNIQQQVNEKQEICVRFIQKMIGYILGIENLSEQDSTFKVIFQGSVNIRVNHYLMEGNELIIQLKGKQQRILQVLPKDPKKAYILSSFDIVKI